MSNHKRSLMDGVVGFNEVTQLPDTKEVLKIFNSNVERNCDLVIAISDIKSFQSINSEYGKIIGDNVLASVAHLIKNYFPKSDFIGHYENDQFYMMFQTDDINNIVNSFNKFNEKLKKGIIIFGETIKCELSVGICLFKHEIDDFLNVLTSTQQAYRKACRNGGIITFERGRLIEN